MLKLIKRLGLVISAPFFVVLIYLVAALLGGLIPVTPNQKASNDGLSKTIYLTSNALHADIAIPVDAFTKEQFSFLAESGFPLTNPNLEYLIIGWGSRDFYTSTAEYSDMEFSTVWRAVTGDASVMHVAPGGDITKSDGVVPVHLTQAGFENMIGFMLESFQSNRGKPVLLEGATFGYGDLFYEAKGRFNIFNPCNVWVSKALHKAGLSSGIWTPTTFSLLLHHKLYH